jgi:hypothetical protein
MGKNKEIDNGSGQVSNDKPLTRREAMKRMALAAALAAVTVAGAPLVSNTDGNLRASDVYINYSKYSTYGSYADPVYLDYSSTGYYSIQYYTSHREKYQMPPLR